MKKILREMWLPFLALAISFVLLATTIAIAKIDAPAPEVEVVTKIEYVTKYVPIEPDTIVPSFVNTKNKDELTALLFECDEREVRLYEMVEECLALGMSESHEMVVYLEEEMVRNDMIRAHYWEIYLEEGYLEWDRRMAEYPTATTIWLFLKDAGYSDEICAAILGNIMVEVGGRTLVLRPLSYNATDSHYGICQWSRQYYPSVDGAPLEVQCEFLKSTIESEIDRFGHLYTVGFDYDTFVNMTNIKSAALAFAKAYERCGAGSYASRQTCALIAYDYFTK